MSFPSKTNDAKNITKGFGITVGCEDENSNKGPSTSSKTIGNIKGRLTFSKQNISSLNTGEPGVSASVKTSIPGKVG